MAQGSVDGRVWSYEYTFPSISFFHLQSPSGHMNTRTKMRMHDPYTAASRTLGGWNVNSRNYTDETQHPCFPLLPPDPLLGFPFFPRRCGSRASRLKKGMSRFRLLLIDVRRTEFLIGCPYHNSPRPLCAQRFRSTVHSKLAGIALYNGKLISP